MYISNSWRRIIVVKGNYKGKPLPLEEKQAIIEDYKNGKGPCTIQHERHHSLNTIRKILDEEDLRHGVSLEEYESQVSPFVVEG
jgi:hypothetical protein